MKTTNISRSFSPSRAARLASLLAAPLLALPAFGGLTELATEPLSGAISMQIKPNIMFIMDDSWSMDWDYLPDWAAVSEDKFPHQRFNPDFNGVAYNPKVTYAPPKYFTAAGALDTTTYPSQTAAETDDWKKVKMDGYGVQYPLTKTANLVNIGAFYYTVEAGEYCTDNTMKYCVTQTAPSEAHPVPALLRWCSCTTAACTTVSTNTSISNSVTPTAGKCQATKIDALTGIGALPTYTQSRMPAPRRSRLAITGTVSTTVTNITVDGKGILSGPVGPTTVPATMAQAVINSINACTYKRTGTCGIAGYRAELAYGSTTALIIHAPGKTASKPILTGKTGTMAFAETAAAAAFARPSSANYVVGEGAVAYVNQAPGENLRTVIESSVNEYPKAATRDCAGATCTYAEEMTNYANWWAYYRTRMQAMKSAASRSFEPIDEKYRIGYFTINNNNSKPGVNKPGYDFQNIAEFSGTQKKDWYDKLFAAIPVDGANTPLRVALSNAGRIYAGLLNKLNGVDVIDPMQYFCQSNSTILSTDGYWNEGAGFKVDGKTLVGDQDGPDKKEPSGLSVIRPQLDAGSGYMMRRTRTLKKTLTPTLQTWHRKMTTQWYVDITKWKKQARNVAQYKSSTLQKRTATIQTRTIGLQYSYKGIDNGGYWADTKNKPIEITAPLLTRTGTAQIKTGTLYVSTQSVMMKKESHLVRTTSTMQATVKQRQQQIVQPMKREKIDGSWVGPTPVDECKTVTSKVECTVAATTGTEEGWYDVATCIESGGNSVTTGEGTDSVSTTYYKRILCRDKTTTTNESPCIAASSTGYTKTCAGINPVVDYPSSCSPDATRGVACRYAPWTEAPWNSSAEWVQDDLCSPSQESAGKYDVSTIRLCQNTGWTPATVATGPCVESATVKCTYSYVITDNTDYPNCPGAAAANYTNLTSKECNVAWSTGTAANEYYVTAASGTCTIKSEGKDRVDCEYGLYTETWVNSTVCPASTPMSTGVTNGTTYTGPARECDVTWSGNYHFVEEASCVSTDTCIAQWGNWTNQPGATPSCTSTTTDTNAATGRLCKYQSAPAFSNGTCPDGGAWSSSAPSTALLAAGTHAPIIQCQEKAFEESDWSNVSSCTPYSDHPATECRYSAWGNVVTGACPADQSALPAFTPGNTLAAGTTYDVATRYTCENVLSNDWVYTVQNDPECADTAHFSCSNFLETEKVTDANYPGFDPAHLPNETGKTFREETATDWEPVSTVVPAATAANPSPVSSVGVCVPGTVNGVTTKCTYHKPGASAAFAVATCANEDASDANNGVKTTCSGDAWTAWCYINGTATPQCAAPKTCEAGTNATSFLQTECTDGAGTPTPDTLADVAQYYFLNDLRTEELGNCTPGSTGVGDVCANGNTQYGQNMTTYTLGLGVSGVMQYQANYKVAVPDKPDDPTATAGDYYSVAHGTYARPADGVCSWQEYGDCNWPKPISNEQTTVDDLWHTAVNGRGTYFSADNPASVAAGISTALEEVLAKDGALASITVDRSALTEDDNKPKSGAFQVSFSSGSWTGDVQRWDLGGSIGDLAKTLTWSAKNLLDGRDYASRTIHFFAPDSDDNLKPFVWGNLTEEQQKFFKKPHIEGLAQLCTTETTCLLPAEHDNAGGEHLVNFLRGERGNEGQSNEPSKYFRQRASVLGDIVNSEAAYVQQPLWTYVDRGYSNFRASMLSREGMIYVGANDGMLHAFKTSNGREEWAYVPTFLLPGLYQLADKNYTSRHQFFADGTPVMGDICTENCAPNATGTVTWKTILVAGVNRGGKGYYALDVTDPAHPKGLWEFTDPNLGYSYGNPLITKLTDGRWVALLTSGYNNTGDGDGKGHLFVLDAHSGEKLKEIVTSEGNVVTPNGVAKITAWANYPMLNNTALWVYGGDLLGNVWRFDLNDIADYGDSKIVGDARLLATLKDSKLNAQPVTTRPELGLVKNNHVVFVGTGQLLGAPDLVTEEIHSVYAIKDRWLGVIEDASSYGYGNPRSSKTAKACVNPSDTACPNFVEQIMQDGGLCPSGNPYCVTDDPIVKISKNLVDWGTKDGWYVDFIADGERVNTTMKLLQGTLVLMTNKPQSGACVPAGVSYVYFLDYETGGYVGNEVDEDGNGFAGGKWGDFLVTSPVFVQNPDGSIGIVAQGDGSGADFIGDRNVPFGDPGDNVRRLSWRELVIE
ncbi:MAG: hypothetical protein LBU43_04895 [Candidatus Accumulibacter sp.]|jgi:Tfp pilus tip-associated adhesin PilY1|nr:hypothetical protein [Accumulibacter sp.]